MPTIVFGFLGDDLVVPLRIARARKRAASSAMIAASEGKEMGSVRLEVGRDRGCPSRRMDT
jgi:hypothetical protein